MKLEINFNETETLAALSGSGVANLISIISLTVAIGAGFVAILAWITTNKHNANQHVHGLFNEYLKFRLQEKARDNITGNAPHAISGNFASMKLYISEEMYHWVLRQNTSHRIFGWIQFWQARSIEDNIESWRRTVVSHILQDPVETRESINDFTSCYSVKFIRFVAEEMKDAELRNLASIHEAAIKNKQIRPLGIQEEKQLEVLPVRLANPKNSN